MSAGRLQRHFFQKFLGFGVIGLGLEDLFQGLLSCGEIALLHGLIGVIKQERQSRLALHGSIHKSLNGLLGCFVGGIASLRVGSTRHINLPEMALHFGVWGVR